MQNLFSNIVLDRKNNSTKSFIILFFYRITHSLYEKKLYVLMKLLHLIQDMIFIILGINAQISYKAIIGSRMRLPHSALGVVISSKAIIGNNVTIFHNVTLGINESNALEEQKIVIDDNCYLSTGCKVISCHIGKYCKIAPNAVVYKDLPDYSLVCTENNIRIEYYKL